MKKQEQALVMPSAIGRQSLHFPLRSSRRTKVAALGEAIRAVTAAFVVGHLVAVGVGVVYRYSVYS